MSSPDIFPLRIILTKHEMESNYVHNQYHTLQEGTFKIPIIIQLKVGPRFLENLNK